MMTFGILLIDILFGICINLIIAITAALWLWALISWWRGWCLKQSTTFSFNPCVAS